MPATLVNPSFEDGTTGWTVTAGSFTTPPTSGGLGGPLHGASFLKPGAAGAVIEQAFPLDPALAHEIGDAVKLKVWAASTLSSGTPGGSVDLLLEALDGMDLPLASVASSFTPTALNTWSDVGAPALTLPAGTAKLMARFTFTGSSSNAIDHVRLNVPWKPAFPLNLEAFQMSDAVGRGYGRRAIV